MRKAEFVSLVLIIALAAVGVVVQDCKPGSSKGGKTKKFSVLLQAPTNLTAALECGNTHCSTHNDIKLKWTNHSNFAEGDLIERMACNDGTTSGVWLDLDVVSGASYKDTHPAPGIAFHYRIKAISATGDSDYSNVASAPGDTSALAAPSHLVGDTASQPVVLSWTRESTNEENFIVEREPIPVPAGSGYQSLAQVDDCNTTYIDDCAKPSTPYFYRISAHNANGISVSDTLGVGKVQVRTKAPLAPPAAPGALTAAAATASQINLSWHDNSNNEDGFRIERSVSLSFGTTNGFTVDPCVVQHGDTHLASNTKYYYRVRALNGLGTSLWSNIAFATTKN